MFAFSTPHGARGDYCWDQHLCARHDVREFCFCMPRSAKTASISIARDRGALWPRVSNSNVSISVSQALCPNRFYTTRSVGVRQRHRDLGEQCSHLSASLYQLVFCDWVQVCGQSQCAYRTVTLPLCAELSWCAGYLWWCREVECAYLSPNIHGVT